MSAPATVSRGASEIESRWRRPLGLAPDNPADPGGQWHGPCPRCQRPKVLSVKPGDWQPVVWNSHCPDHPDEAVYAALRHLVPTAPPPGHGKAKAADAAALADELAALKERLARIRALVLNPGLKGKPKDLAILLETGDTAPAALDALEVGDKGNRSRYQTEVRRALAVSPGKVVRYDNRRRSAAGKREKALSPAEVVISDNRAVVTSDNRYSCESDSLTSGNGELTERATLVLPPGGTDTPTQDTDTRALEVLRDALGAEVITIEPRPDPLPVADAIDAWTSAEEGSCTRCGARTCRYGDRGSPLCADCRLVAVGVLT